MFRLLQSLIGSQGGRVPLAGQGRSPCRRQAKPPHEVRILRAEHGYSAHRRAVKRPKSAKGVWGKTRVFPHKQHIVFVEPFLRNSPVDCFGRTLHI